MEKVTGNSNHAHSSITNSLPWVLFQELLCFSIFSTTHCLGETGWDALLITTLLSWYHFCYCFSVYLTDEAFGKYTGLDVNHIIAKLTIFLGLSLHDYNLLSVSFFSMMGIWEKGGGPDRQFHCCHDSNAFLKRK
jgi:hypothetical protein